MPFSEVFGGTLIYPSNATYIALTLTANVELQWPIEQAVGGEDIVADIIDLSASAPGLAVTIPDARQVSTGYTALFNNVGAETVTIRDAIGNTIISVASGSAWQIYLRDNSTEAGSWRSFQYGAAVSVANAGALAGAGLKAITTTLNQALAVTSFAATPTTVVNNDRAKIFNWTGGAGVLNLPDPLTVGNDWFLYVRNSGSGDLTVTPAAGQIDAGASKTFGLSTSAMIVCDGANYFTVGYGSGSGGGSSFDYLSIDVSGSGTYTLTGAQLNRISYQFTGVLTGDRTIVVPATIQQYWVRNSTTGAFRLYIKTLAQAAPGIEVLQNNANITYCDGANVVDAESSTVTFPIPVAQGGTGSTTAANARVALSVPGLSDPNTYTGGAQVASDAAPSWRLNETDAAANNRLWALRVQGEQLLLQAVDDAGTGFGTAIAIDRTLNVIDLIALTATSITLTGAATVTGTLAVSGTITSGGVAVALSAMTQNSQSGNYTTVLGDAGNSVFHPTGAGAGDVFTIAANASVSYPIGTMIEFINWAVDTVSIAIAGGDTLRWLGIGSTGTRTLAQYGKAVAEKIAATEWAISGIGLG